MRRPEMWNKVKDQISGLPLVLSGRKFHDLLEWQEAIRNDNVQLPRAGDVILVEAKKAGNAVVLAQEAIGYPESAARTSHAALYLGNGKVCDANLYSGVKNVKFSEAYANCLISFVRPLGVTETEGEKVALWAARQAGQRYSPGQALRVIAGRLRYLRAKQGSVIEGAGEQFVEVADRILRLLSERDPQAASWDLHNASLNEKGILGDFLADEGITSRFICSSLVSDAYFSVMGLNSPLNMSIYDYSFPFPTPAEMYLNPRLIDLTLIN